MMINTHPVRSSDYINSLLAGAELAAAEPQAPSKEELAVMVDMSDCTEAEEPCDTQTDVDEHGRLITTYLPPLDPQLHPGADYHAIGSRAEAEALLKTCVGWLTGRWGHIANAPEHWVRIAAANVLINSADDDSWLTD